MRIVKYLRFFGFIFLFLSSVSAVCFAQKKGKEKKNPSVSAVKSAAAPSKEYHISQDAKSEKKSSSDISAAGKVFVVFFPGSNEIPFETLVAKSEDQFQQIVDNSAGALNRIEIKSDSGLFVYSTNKLFVKKLNDSIPHGISSAVFDSFYGMIRFLKSYGVDISSLSKLYEAGLL